MKTIKISVPGKIILMGEHAVVHHRPAIVASVNKKISATIKSDGDLVNTSIKSQIPMGSGMGSSAAISVIQAATKYVLSGKTVLNNIILSKINQQACENEKIYHLNSSGVDPTICTYGGIIWFKKTKNGHKIFKRLSIKRLPKFVLVNTGRPAETTGQMVGRVGEKLKKEKNKVNRIFDVIEDQTKLFLCALEKKDSNLISNTIQNCESCLEDLGVVSEKAKDIVREIEEIGGVAKISGAGGMSCGSGMLLCFHKNPQKILKLAKKLKLEAFIVKLGNKGVKINESN